FVTPRELPPLRLIEKRTTRKIERVVPPTNTKAPRGQQQTATENSVTSISENDVKKYHETPKELLDDHDAVSLVSAALSLITKERRDSPVRISGGQPISVKGPGKGRGGNRKSGGKRFYNKKGGGKGRSRQDGRNRNNRGGSRNDGRRR